MAFDTNEWTVTPDDSEAMHKHQVERLKVQAELLIRAFEAAELPKDHVGIDKAAKALISINKAVKEIYAADPKSPKSKDTRDDEMNDDTEAADLAEYKSRAIAEDPRCALWADWQFKLERKITHLAESRRSQGHSQRDDGERPSSGVEEHLGAR